MKKLLALLLALIMVLSFAACGEDGGNDTQPGGNNGGETEGTKEITGETYNAGNFTALVPDGWMAFPVSDMWSDDPDATDPNGLQICKGGETEWDLFTKPYVDIDYYGPETSMSKPSSEWYDNATDLEPITAGSLTWTGFTATSLEMPLAILWAEDGDHQYQVTLWLELTEGNAIAPTDADVVAILASLKPAT